MKETLPTDGADERSRNGGDEALKVQQVLDENPDLLSPIPCASPSEEPQVDEVISSGSTD